jgi:hypothetical protein
MQAELADLLNLFSQTLTKLTLSEFHVGRIPDEAFEALTQLGRIEQALSLIEQIEWQSRQVEIRNRVKIIAQSATKLPPNAKYSLKVEADQTRLTKALEQTRKLDSRTKKVEKFCAIACNLAELGLVAQAKTILLEEALPVAFAHDHPPRRQFVLSHVANTLAYLDEANFAWPVLKEVLINAAKPYYNEWYYEALTAIAIGLAKAGQIEQVLEIITPLKSVGKSALNYVKTATAVINSLQVEGQQPTTIITNLQHELDSLLQAALDIPYNPRWRGESEEKYLELIRTIANGAALAGQATQAASLLQNAVISKVADYYKYFRLEIGLCLVIENLILAGFLPEAHVLFDELVTRVQTETLQLKTEAFHPDIIAWVGVTASFTANQSILLALALAKPVEQILALARQIEFAYYQIRALRVLASYMSEQGQPEQANQMLAEAQGVFKPYFETRDKALHEQPWAHRFIIEAKRTLEEGGLARTWDGDPWQNTIHNEERLYRTGLIGAIRAEVRSPNQHSPELNVEARQHLIATISAKCIAATNTAEFFQVALLTQPLIETEPEFGWQLYQMFHQIAKLPQEQLFKRLDWPEQFS